MQFWQIGQECVLLLHIILRNEVRSQVGGESTYCADERGVRAVKMLEGKNNPRGLFSFPLPILTDYKIPRHSSFTLISVFIEIISGS